LAFINKKLAAARPSFDLDGLAHTQPEIVYVPVFAALGDETRLALVAKLCERSPQSISQLTDGSKLTRQAITKHLAVLESAGVVGGVRVGRERQFAFDPKPFDDAKGYLEEVSRRRD
jgi:DNA-binding transcriptional ArsR family regulator